MKMNQIISTLVFLLFTLQDDTHKYTNFKPYTPDPIEVQHVLFLSKSDPRINSTIFDSLNEYYPIFTTMAHILHKYALVRVFTEGKSSAEVKLIYDQSIRKYMILKIFEGIPDRNIRLNETSLFREVLISLYLNEIKYAIDSQFIFHAELYDFGVIISDKSNIYQPYFIMEYIEGQTMKEYIIENIVHHRYKTSLEIKSILFQILYFLYIAYKNLEFIHQDLHYYNIQITDRKLDNFHIYLEFNEIKYYLNGPQVMIFDFGYSSIDPLRLTQPGTDQWVFSRKGTPAFRNAICSKYFGDNINDTHFLWREAMDSEPEIIKKHTCLMHRFCAQFSGLMASFLCEYRDSFKNIVNDYNVQRYIMNNAINYDLKYWLIYFSLLNADRNEPFIKCDTFQSCFNSSYFSELKRAYF